MVDICLGNVCCFLELKQILYIIAFIIVIAALIYLRWKE